LPVVWFNEVKTADNYITMGNSQNQFKMKNYILLFAAVGLITMGSCTPAKKESKPVQVQQQTQEPQTIVKPDTSARFTSVPATSEANEPAVVNAAATPPKLNPAHGQPFHRCDIAVGSPLDAAPAKPATTVISTGGAPTLENAARLNNPQVNNSSAPTVANATPPKLNPPHGQPFHKCEIPVGSPLN